MKYLIILIILFIGCDSYKTDNKDFYTELCNRKAYQSFKYGYWQAINDVDANFSATGDISGSILDSLYWLRLGEVKKQFKIKDEK